MGSTTAWTRCGLDGLESGRAFLYFAGDTGYNAHDFKATGAKFGAFDLALIPIGAYEPAWFMKTMHINPEEAVRIHQEVGSRLSRHPLGDVSAHRGVAR